MQQSEELPDLEETTSNGIDGFPLSPPYQSEFNENIKPWYESDEMSGSRLCKLLKKDSHNDFFIPRRYRMPSFSESILPPAPSSNFSSDSFVQKPLSFDCFNSSQGSSPRKPIIKIANFPWEVTKEDFAEFLMDFSIEESKIHIPIDRSTGKTKNEAYVELRELPDAERCIATLNRRFLKGRPVSVQSSSFTELFNTHFPFAASEQNIFLTKEEINSILTICKNYKVNLHFIVNC